MTKTYTLQHEVAIEIDQAFDGLVLVNIQPTNETERLLICGPNGDDGELFCWDAVVEIKDGNLVCEGSSTPGGMGEEVVLIVPLTLATKLMVEAAPFGMIDLNEYGIERFLTEGLDCA